MKTKKLLIMLYLLMMSVNAHSVTNCEQTDITGVPQSECQALVALYNTTNGKEWINNTNWDTLTPCNTWFGVSVEDGFVTALSLAKNNLKSNELPQELINLTHLNSLELVGNRLSGNLPSFLPQIPNLKELYLDENYFTGSIPPEYGNFKEMLSLWMATNQLSGEIPPELGNLNKLKTLVLSGNLFTGSIPPSLGNLSNVKRLALDNNHLTGQIPHEFGQLQNLEYLVLFSNHLEGVLPPEIGNLSNLLVFDIDINHVGGTIPPEWGKLKKLFRLDFDYNRLTGTIPPEMGNMTALTDLYMRYNQLSGQIPAELGNLVNLKKFFLEHNQLSGKIPASFGNLKELVWLHLHENQLTGNLPAELGYLSKLERLYLQDNNFSGEIPSSFKLLHELTNKTGLSLRYNQLFTQDTDLATFLTTKHTELIGNLLLPSWEQTQTLPVLDVTASHITDTSVSLTWQTLPFAAENAGFYRVWYGTQANGPYTHSGETTLDKSTALHTVNHLNPASTYYFVVETHTPAHQTQQNYLVSSLSYPLKVTTQSSNKQVSPPDNQISIHSLVDEKNQIAPLNNINSITTVRLPEISQKYSLVVHREGNVNSEASVEYLIQSISAEEYMDFKFTGEPQGKLTFKANETSKTINFEIKDDQEEEDAEVLRIYLFNSSDNTALGTDNALITIEANDQPVFKAEDWILLRVGDMYSNYLQGGEGTRFIVPTKMPDAKMVKLSPYQGGDFLSFEAIGPGKTTMTLSDSAIPPHLIPVEITISVPAAEKLDDKHPPYRMILRGNDKRSVNIVLPMEVPESDNWIEDKSLFFIIQFPFNQPAEQFWQISKAGDNYQLVPFNNNSPFLGHRQPWAAMDLSKELKNVSGFNFTMLNLSPAHGGLNFDGKTVNIYEGFTNEDRSQMTWTWYQIIIE
ncbi:MAG: hypothetical protein RIT27_1130 [Pseudomonadota bacterium]|jgi:Leucine-rich repeat (LRR) protein